MSTLQASGLRYELGGRTILSDVDLELRAGACVAVTGPSGSGKTSLLTILAGFVSPQAGTVRFDGRLIAGPVAPADGLAVVLQGYGLVALLTAAENVEVALRAAGTRPREASALAVDALGAVGLANHAHHLVEELSGGQRQRIAVARALALKPTVILADEPTAELDPAARTLVVEALFALPARGTSLLIATHDPDLASRCDQVLELRASRR